MVEASTSTTKGTRGSGCRRMGAVLNAFLRRWKASWASGVPGQGLGLALQHGGERRCEPTEQVDETPIEVRKS